MTKGIGATPGPWVHRASPLDAWRPLGYLIHMKKTLFLYMFLGLLTFAGPSHAMGGAADASQTAQTPEAAMKAAQQDLKQAAEDFSAGQKTAQGQVNGQTPLSEALNAGQNGASANASQPDPRNQALQGSPETGYAGTWTDPATGDVITSVISPTPPPPTQNYPMVIEPQVSGGNYYGGSSGVYERNWSQWPTSPDNPGYPSYGNQQNPPQGQHYPGWMPPYPGQPYPGFNPYPGMNYPPGWWQHQAPGPGYHGNFPPQGNFNPNYRPLTPPQPPAQGGPGSMQPSWPAQNRPPSGAMQPAWPGNNPGATGNGGLWQPGMTPPAAPTQPQLPMRPGGHTWGNPGPGQGMPRGAFGHPGAPGGF